MSDLSKLREAVINDGLELPCVVRACEGRSGMWTSVNEHQFLILPDGFDEGYVLTFGGKVSRVLFVDDGDVDVEEELEKMVPEGGVVNVANPWMDIGQIEFSGDMSGLSQELICVRVVKGVRSSIEEYRACVGDSLPIWSKTPPNRPGWYWVTSPDWRMMGRRHMHIWKVIESYSGELMVVEAAIDDGDWKTIDQYKWVDGWHGPLNPPPRNTEEGGAV